MFNRHETRIEYLEWQMKRLKDDRDRDFNSFVALHGEFNVLLKALELEIKTGPHVVEIEPVKK